MEIFHLASEFDSFEYLALVPIVYIVVHLILDIWKQKVADLNKFFIYLTIVMVILSLICLVLNLSKVQNIDYVNIMFFISNMIVFQKLVFIQIIIFLLKIYDIGVIKLRNQMNSNFLILKFK